MKFIYFYSPFYKFYHDQFQEKITPHFESVPLLIDDIKESENKNVHHFDGLTIKVELIIDQIENEMGTNIIFSDATCFINKETIHDLEKFINSYSDYDICFIKEGHVFNIGFMKINCNNETLSFFNKVLQTMKSGEITHDQECINSLLSTSGLKYTTFDNNIIYCSNFDPSKKNFIVYKSFIRNNNKIDNFNQRIQIFYDNKLIDESVYKKYYVKAEGFSTQTPHEANQISFFYIYVKKFIPFIITFVIVFVALFVYKKIFAKKKLSVLFKSLMPFLFSHFSDTKKKKKNN